MPRRAGADVGATLVVAPLPADAIARDARIGRPQGSPLQQAMLEDAACARRANVMTLVDAPITSD